ncbi:C-X-C motif chemokine 9 [Sminthopsis crassicaudata]|uniref:C-X-C motif chemokine 9 n=1 Tax=Sminthopsis crassicaudata TaxID=9301 RepID=UPI003D6823E2
MKSCHIAFFWGIFFLTLMGVQAFLIFTTGRCSCINVSKGKIQKKNIENLVRLPSTPFCSHVEIIVTMKNGEEKCLDPDSPYVKFLEKYWKKMTDKKKKPKTGNKRQVKNGKKFKKAHRPPPRKTA